MSPSNDKAKTDLEELCRSPLQADPDIQDIIQFGSSVYAPDLALDIDLLVTTAAKKDDDLYWDTVADWPVNVDIIVREGDCPRQNVEGEFQQWRERVSRFIDVLCRGRSERMPSI